ncbi:MGMT family protein [Haloarchaeobius iranensis]|uniref:Methylated-DNA-[protein]-cysteine S-methyltransferase n=1 Tax=Haloarchaeobius iranensis TaxID=996166 RepID=A0A1G9TBR4_9EURY|nr:MGMT family protein [Haloarchaeobius iranensis]SDM45116.1 methylated-DNA-[protein]-cysteine S-methyltransferase [Haloarchaeobius iranensis]
MDADDAGVAGIYARHSPFLDRDVQIGVASGRVISVSFPEGADADAGADHPVLDRIDEYLDGVASVAFDDVEAALTLPTDQRTVLETLREQVPYGEDVSVAQLARLTPGLDAEDDDDLVLVRTALDANPVPLLVPDHRVRDGPSAAEPHVEQKLRSIEGL